MLSTFGVLRHPPGAGETLPPGLSDSRPFIKYIRVARRAYGSVYEVIPVKEAGIGLRLPMRCLQLELTALKADVAHAPRPVRVLALRSLERGILNQHEIARHPGEICLFGGGGGGCEEFFVAESKGGLQSTGYGGGGIWDYLVPDGVATVTADYPADGPKTGYRRSIPAQTVTARVINNVAIWTLANEAGDNFPSTITWRSSNGTIIKVVHNG